MGLYQLDNPLSQTLERLRIRIQVQHLFCELLFSKFSEPFGKVVLLPFPPQPRVKDVIVERVDADRLQATSEFLQGFGGVRGLHDEGPGSHEVKLLSRRRVNGALRSLKIVVQYADECLPQI